MVRFPSNHRPLLLSFLQGLCVLSVELLAAKLISPYYGLSLYIWSSVLGVTLFSLAAGYFTGAGLSSGRNRESRIFLLIGL